MGELLLCTQAIAAMPYYLENGSVNVYSIEELCYYILENTYILDKSFICEELCGWIEKSLKKVSLADTLRDIRNMDGSLSTFIITILRESGYVDDDRIILTNSILQEMEEKSDFECSKIRADRLMDKDKILSAVYEYKRLLKQKDADNQPKNLIGNVWHNLGVAYSRMFIFEEAAKCFSRAYELNGDKESKKEELFAIRCQRDEYNFEKKAKEAGYDEMKIIALKNELTLLSRESDTEEFENRVDSIADKTDNREEKARELKEIIIGWKEDYRKISGL